VSERRLHFNAPSKGGRLDITLASQVPDVSRNRIQSWIKKGLVRVDGVVIEKPGHHLDGGEKLEATVPAPAPTDLQPEHIPLDIVFENQDVIILNKPPGMVVHPSAGHVSGTLVQAVLAHAPDIQGIGDELRPGVVHRLDKDTSGLIIFAKHDRAHQWMLAQFKDREVEKRYLAILDGKPPTPAGRIDAAIGRDSRHRQKMAVVPPSKGREALTVYKTLEEFPDHTFVEVFPRTGRTHQIRVHMAFLGCPVTGDRIYGRRQASLPVERQMLHAQRLGFCLPGENSPTAFEAQLPTDFNGVLMDLRRIRG
jgi:23S rRNA pseudouridine1911/1915/1917 synthase